MSSLPFFIVTICFNNHLFGFSTENLILLLLVLFRDFQRDISLSHEVNIGKMKRLFLNSTFPSHSWWPLTIALSFCCWQWFERTILKTGYFHPGTVPFEKSRAPSIRDGNHVYSLTDISATMSAPFNRFILLIGDNIYVA